MALTDWGVCFYLIPASTFGKCLFNLNLDHALSCLFTPYPALSVLTGLQWLFI